MRRSARFFSRRSLPSLSALICLLLFSGPALAAQDLSRAIVKPFDDLSEVSFFYIDLQDAGEIAARLASSKMFLFLDSSPRFLSRVKKAADNFPAQELILLASLPDERRHDGRDSIQLAMRYGDELRPALARLAAGAAEEEDIASLLGFIGVSLTDLARGDETGSKAPYSFVYEKLFLSAHDDVLLISNNDKLIERSLASLRSLSDRYSFKNSTARKSTARNRVLYQVTALFTDKILADPYKLLFGFAGGMPPQGHYVDTAIDLGYKGFELDIKSNFLPLMFSKLVKESSAPKQFQLPRHGAGRLVMAAERANSFSPSVTMNMYHTLAECLMGFNFKDEFISLGEMLSDLPGNKEKSGSPAVGDHDSGVVLTERPGPEALSNYFELMAPNAGNIFKDRSGGKKQGGSLFLSDHDSGFVLTERPDSGALSSYFELMAPNVGNIFKDLPATEDDDQESNWPQSYELPITTMGSLKDGKPIVVANKDGCLIGVLPLATLDVPPTTSAFLKTLVEQPLIGYSYFDMSAVRRILNARRNDDNYNSWGKTRQLLFQLITVATIDCHEVGSQILSADHFVLRFKTGWLDFDGRELLRSFFE